MRSHRWIVVLAIAIAVGVALPTSMSFSAPGVSISGASDEEYAEQSGPQLVATGVSFTAADGFADGSLEFSLTGADVAADDTLGFEEVASLADISTGAGEVSVLDGKIYVGLGGGDFKQIATVDTQKNGETGNDLKVSFSASLNNASFDTVGQDGLPEGWTFNNNRVQLGSLASRTQGKSISRSGPVNNIYTYTGTDSITNQSYSFQSNFNYDSSSKAAWGLEGQERSSSLSTSVNRVSSFSTQNNVLKLESTGTCSSPNSSYGNGTSFCSVFGPEAVSSAFDAKQGDDLSFKWAAERNGDDYEIYAFLEQLDGNSDVTNRTILAYGRGASQSWTESTASIPTDGRFQFRFVNGTYDQTGLYGIGSTMYIDDIRVVSEDATDSVASALAQKLTFSSTDKSAGDDRTLQIRAEQADGTAQTDSLNITFGSLVNDAPEINIDSAGPGQSKTETVNEARFTMPDVVGSLSATDPDEDSPQFTFSIDGGTVSGNSVTKQGEYGLLTVDNDANEYTYEPDLSAIEPLDTGESDSDQFTLSVSDGALSGSATLSFTINGFTDSISNLDGAASTTEGAVDLSWSSPTDDGLNTLTGYVIEAKQRGTNTYSTVTDSDGNDTDSAATVTGLDACVAYDFRVAPVFGAGTGVYTAPVTVTAFGSSGLTDYSTNAFVTRGDASRSGSLITLTDDEPSQAGALWNTSRFDLGESFCVTAEVKLSDESRVASGTAGADGIAFVLQPADTTKLSPGGGLGYSPAIDPALAVEFDTYQNPGDVAQQEIAVRVQDGPTASDNDPWTSDTAGVDVTAKNLEDGEFHKTQIRYDAHQNLLTVLFDFNSDGDFADAGEVVFENIEKDINTFFSSTDLVYWGFTAATGGQTNLQQVRNISYLPGSLAANTSPSATSPGAQTVAVGATTTVNVTLEDNLETAQDQWRLSVASSNPAFVESSVEATSQTNAEVSLTGLADGDTVITVTAIDADGASVSSSFNLRVGAGTQVPRSRNNNDAPAPLLPVVTNPNSGPPAVVAPRAATPPQTNLPVTRSGPVLRNGVAPQVVRVPEARVGGVTTPVETTVSTQSFLTMRTGALSLGVQVPEGLGSINQSADGETEIAVQKGSRTTLSGSGLAPGSTVQVFLPLQGTNAKELTRIPVGPDGAFSGDAAFATAPNEAPLPVGRQVMQMVSLDADGNEVVVDMTINIAQPAPAPEFNRVDGVIPTLAPGTSIATNAGVPEEVRVTAVEDQKLAVVEGSDWSMAVAVPAEEGAVEASEGGASIKLVRDESAQISGEGFMPGTRADVWLFSEPTLLGTVTIGDDGRFDGEFNIDGRIVTAGEHTLQMQGIGKDGYVRAANMGVVVDDVATEAASATSESSLAALWWALGAIVVLAAVGGGVALNRRRLV